jgi:hypothetical protein
MLLHHLNKDRNHLDHSHQCQLVTWIELCNADMSCMSKSQQ